METKCPLCGCAEIIKRKQVWKDGRKFNYGLCLHCGIVSRYPLTNKEFETAATYKGKVWSEDRGNEIRRLKKMVKERDGCFCNNCGIEEEDTLLQLDHILAEMFGGTDDFDNLQMLCISCNSKKGTSLNNPIINYYKRYGVHETNND